MNKNNGNLDIALSLSGGGYRAAVFHIGVLSYLYRIKLADGSRLLEHVTVMSTISGGSIVGLWYMLANNDIGAIPNRLFELFSKLKEHNLAEEVLADVAKNKDNPRLSLIKELSNRYSCDFFQNEKFETIINNVRTGPVHHYAAYSTDIKNSMAFRFQAVSSAFPEANVGNRKRRIDLEDAKELRLADILAASSCFPLVFEPINYPRDFFSFDAESEDAQTMLQIPIMDGGIIDNQGIDYVLSANKNMLKAGNLSDGIDLAIISDAAYSVEEDNKADTSEKFPWWAYLTIGDIYEGLWAYTWAFFGVGFLCFIFCCYLGWGFGSGVGITLLALFFLARIIKKKTPKDLLENEDYKIPENLVWNIRFFQYYRLIKKRYESFSKVVNTVMMGHIRESNLKMIKLSDELDHIFVIPEIGKLSANGRMKKRSVSNYNPSEDMMQNSDDASSFHTTLWFSPKDIADEMPEKIFACGQYTICYELLQWISQFDGRHKNVKSVGKILNTDEIRKQLENDWKQFCDEPRYFIDINHLNQN